MPKFIGHAGEQCREFGAGFGRAGFGRTAVAACLGMIRFPLDVVIDGAQDDSRLCKRTNILSISNREMQL
jgi:hypothetical protein